MAELRVDLGMTLSMFSSVRRAWQEASPLVAAMLNGNSPRGETSTGEAREAMRSLATRHLPRAMAVMSGERSSSSRGSIPCWRQRAKRVATLFARASTDGKLELA